jgi:hypothetical protein
MWMMGVRLGWGGRVIGPAAYDCAGVWGRGGWAGFEVVCDAGGQLSGPVSFALGAASAWEVRRVGCGVACLDEDGGRHG